MKKITALFIVVLMLVINFNISFAEEETEVEYALQNEVNFHAEILADDAKERHFAFILLACDGQTELGRVYVNTEEWETSFNMNFSVPEYEIGEKFIIKLFSDNAKLIYNGETGNEVILETYVTTDENGKVMYQTSFYGEIQPYSEKAVSIKIKNNEFDTEYRIFGNEIYVSEDIVKELKINITKEEGSWFLSSHTEGFSMQFFKDNIYATRNGVGYNLNYPVFEEDGKGFLPLYDIAVYFACDLKDEDKEDCREISMMYSYYGIVPAMETFVNESGVDSRTEYLIWISKSTHTVNIFTGKKDFWHHYKTYPCALGAPSTPTIEGQFEYIERLNRWTYPNYYCGPVMRFHNGYALHSTLIRYNGTPYDDRVGVNISLGCIRLHPADIQELVSFIPFKTRIYITAE